MARVEYTVDPARPRAPSQEIWDALTPEQRANVVASLPDSIPFGEVSPPEGDWHREAKQDALDALRHFFQRTGRGVYVSSELTVYYPNADRFCPDLLAVFDVPTHKRTKWVVTKEGKGLDFVLEVHYGGDRKKDTEDNVSRYARLGVPEYFIHDRQENRLIGYRLPMKGAKAYVPILAQLGRYRSEVLNLELTIQGDRLRFLYGDAEIPWNDELVTRLNQAMSQQEDKLEKERQLRLEAERQRDEEATKRIEAEQRAAALEAELERLRNRRS
jgi:Uma2 family endonuclease